MMMDGDFETTTWRDLFEGSEDIDYCKDELQRIAILYSRCGSNRHQECWHQVDSDLQYEERVKISKIKRGGHSHRQTNKSRPRQSDDDEIIVDPLGPSPAKELLDKYNNGTLTKGDVRDFTSNVMQKKRVDDESKCQQKYVQTVVYHTTKK